MKDWWTQNHQEMKAMGMESVSGTGSTLDATKTIRDELPPLLKSLGVRSLLDIPCGDVHWMSKVDIDDISYWGADIVPANVEHNHNRYGYRNGICFIERDITKDELIPVDLIFCRDCLVHFSTEDIWKALRNIYTSGAKYLLTTTFTERKENHDIPTGGWQTLNLQIAPFFFPEPLAIINERCPEQDGAYADKSLALWKITDLEGILPIIEEAQ